MLNANQHEITKLNDKLATMTDGEELSDLSALKERKVDTGLAINRVLLHAGEYFTAYAEQARMFDVRDALVELTGVLPRGAPHGYAINISRFYGREMHVLTILQRAGDVEPITLNVLSTIWSRLKGKGGLVLESVATRTVFICPEEEGTVRGAPYTGPFIVTSPNFAIMPYHKVGRPRGMFRVRLCASASKQWSRQYRRHRRARGRPSTERKTLK